MSNVLEITIQKSYRQRYPVTANFYQEGSWLAPVRKDGSLIINQHQETALRAAQLNPEAYGTLLGKALFQESLRDVLMRAAAAPLRLLLLVEDPRLKQFRWERLCAPIGPNGAWQMLAFSQQILFSSTLPSRVENNFPLIGRQDLRALIVIANPPPDNPYGLKPFSGELIAQRLHEALHPIPHDFLATFGDDLPVVGSPTLDCLCEQLTVQPYTLLHLVAHGAFSQAQTEPIVYLLDEAGQVQPVLASNWITRFAPLRRLPHLVCLSACDTASTRLGPSAQGDGVMEGLAQQMAQDLGLPAVIGMAGRVSMTTADDLMVRFYPRLWEHGEVNLALREAVAPLAARPDVTVPILYSRLGRHPLWADTLDRPLTGPEIRHGLQVLAGLVEERLPGLRGRVTHLTHGLQQYLGSPESLLSVSERQQHEQMLHDLDRICQETLDVTFQAFCVGRVPPLYDVRCPFRGLASFRQEDSPFFCGRESLTDTLVAHIRQAHFLAVIGPSGSGKSSLVQAGLLPALQKEDPSLLPIIIRPGQYPDATFRANAAAFRSPHALIVVDQFEELFTQCTEEERRQWFIEELLKLLPERRVILTLREDFLAECNRFPDLKKWLAEQRQLIDRLELPELRRAIEGQAASVGLRFESDLAQRLVEDVEGEPGAMILLQVALKMLWQQRHGKWLSVAAYRDSGGVQQLAATIAEDVYRLLPPQQQAQARWLFLRLVKPDDAPVLGTRPRDIRLRLPFAALVSPDVSLDELRRLAHHLADKGLLAISVNDVTGQEQVELSHEALFWQWPRLRTWLSEGRIWLALLTRLRENVALWERSNRDASYLWYGRQLAEVQQQIPGEFFAAAEQQFITACKQAEQVEQQKHAQEKRWQTRQKYFRRVLAGSIVILLGYWFYSYLWTHYPLIPAAAPSVNTLSVQLQSVNLPAAERERLEQAIATIPLAEGPTQGVMTITAQPGDAGMMHLTITLPITPAYRLDFWEEIRTLEGDVPGERVDDVSAAAAAYSLGDYPEVINRLERATLAEQDGISLVLLAQAYLFEEAWEQSQMAYLQAIRVAAADESRLRLGLALAYWRPALRRGGAGTTLRAQTTTQNNCATANTQYELIQEDIVRRDKLNILIDLVNMLCKKEYNNANSRLICSERDKTLVDSETLIYCDFLTLTHAIFVFDPTSDLTLLPSTRIQNLLTIQYTYTLLPLLNSTQRDKILNDVLNTTCSQLYKISRTQLYTRLDRLNYQWLQANGCR